MYPILRDDVNMGTFQYEGDTAIQYFIQNAAGDEFVISKELYDALLEADGTEPLNLPQDSEDLIPKLQELGLIATSRFVVNENTLNRFIIFIIGKRGKKFRAICQRINGILPILSVGIFVVGILAIACNLIWFENSRFDWTSNFGLTVYWWICVLFSLILHETGHLIAGLALDYKITDIGLLLFGFFPVGGYVAHEEKEYTTRKEKLQFSLAGIEVNLIIAGVCLLVSLIYPVLTGAFTSVANINIILVVGNLLPVSGFDGEDALNAAFGVNNIHDIAKRYLKSKTLRRQLLHEGFHGWTCLLIFAVTVSAKILFAIAIILCGGYAFYVHA